MPRLTSIKQLGSKIAETAKRGMVKKQMTEEEMKAETEKLKVKIEYEKQKAKLAEMKGERIKRVLRAFETPGGDKGGAGMGLNMPDPKDFYGVDYGKPPVAKQKQSPKKKRTQKSAEDKINDFYGFN